MKAAQLQNTKHLGPTVSLATHDLQVTTKHLLYTELGRTTLMCKCMNWVFVGSHNYQTRYTTCGQECQVSIAKTAFCVSIALVQRCYMMDQQRAHTLTDNVYIQVSK